MGQDGNGVELLIGKNVAGEASHGAASLIGTFQTYGEAVDNAISRGVPPENIEMN